MEETPLLFTNQQSHAEPDSAPTPGLDTDKPPEGPFALGVALERPAVVDPDDIPSLQGNEVEGSSEVADAEGAVSGTANSEEIGTDETPEVAEEASTDEDVVPDELTPANLAPENSRMVVIGNSTFATDGLFNQYLNGDIFLNSVGWLSQIERPTLSIRPKEPTNRRLNITEQQKGVIQLLSWGVFPLLGLVGAISLWTIRR